MSGLADRGFADGDELAGVVLAAQHGGDLLRSRRAPSRARRRRPAAIVASGLAHARRRPRRRRGPRPCERCPAPRRPTPARRRPCRCRCGSRRGTGDRSARRRSRRSRAAARARCRRRRPCRGRTARGPGTRSYASRRRLSVRVRVVLPPHAPSAPAAAAAGTRKASDPRASTITSAGVVPAVDDGVVGQRPVREEPPLRPIGQPLAVGRGDERHHRRDAAPASRAAGRPMRP